MGRLLDHLGEALAVFLGTWRFLLSRSCRKRKLGKWREALPIPGGKAVIAGEVVAPLPVGVLLPRG